MSKDKLDYLVWSAKDKINHIVTHKDVTIEDIHAAIQELRAFLEARAAQTATPFVPPGSELPYSPKAPPIGGDLAAPGMAAALEADAIKLAQLAHNMNEPDVGDRLALDLAIFGTAVLKVPASAPEVSPELAALL